MNIRAPNYQSTNDFKKYEKNDQNKIQNSTEKFPFLLNRKGRADRRENSYFMSFHE